MRKFWIEYANRLLLDLNGGSHVNLNTGVSPTHEMGYLKNALFLTDPSGLGITFSTNFEYAGGGAYACTFNRRDQIVVAGVLNIKPNGVSLRNVYNNYTLLASLITGKLVTLYYCPYAELMPEYNAAYRADGYVTKLAKTEKKAGRLAVGFEFRAVTPWYTVGTATMPRTMTAGSTFTFAGMVGDTAFDALFTAGGTSVSNFEATIRRGSEELACLKFADSIRANKVVEWSTFPERRAITLAGEDILSRVDLTRNVFPLIRADDVLEIGSSMTGSLTFSAKYKVFYGGV